MGITLSNNGALTGRCSRCRGIQDTGKQIIDTTACFVSFRSSGRRAWGRCTGVLSRGRKVGRRAESISCVFWPKPSCRRPYHLYVGLITTFLVGVQFFYFLTVSSVKVYVFLTPVLPEYDIGSMQRRYRWRENACQAWRFCVEAVVPAVPPRAQLLFLYSFD
jgi:hypothetical protein